MEESSSGKRPQSPPPQDPLTPVVEKKLRPYERHGMIALVLSVAILVIGFIFILNTKKSQLAGTAHSVSDHYRPSQTHEKSQAQNPSESLRSTTALPPSQEGLSPSQATVFLEVGTESQYPQFTQNELSVKTNEIVSLRFVNQSLPQLRQSHAWVLVKPGTEGKVAWAAQQTGLQNDFIPESPDIIARTDLIPPGESETIVFRAPQDPGDYPYICVFPGHSESMHGVLKVQPLPH